MLAGVKRPDGRTITFGYDALGRRVSKTVDGTVRRFGWDGNVVLHEWDISEADRPKLVPDAIGREEYDGPEHPEHLVTWVYDGTSFTPVAKVAGGERYTIVQDYLGTPTQAYDSKGELVWEMLIDVYGNAKEYTGEKCFIPFRYQGQYEDEGTGLYYNRFRYYSPQIGMYISSDPIGLAGNNPTLYGYVPDVNTWLDVFGLKCNKKGPDIPDYHKKNFTEGIVTMRQVNGDEIFYKYHGKSNRLGREYNYVTNKKYTSEKELREDLAILEEWGVEIESVTTFKPQAGTWIGEGTAARQVSSDGTERLAGGGYQGIIHVHNLPKSTIIQTVKVNF